MDLKVLISSVRQLPTLPSIVTDITKKTADPRTNARELGEIIASDLSISSKVLKTVNSARYGFKRSINDINSAIVALGFDAVRDIALSIAVFESLTHRGDTGVFDRTRFWKHSLGTAVASQIVGRLVNYPDVKNLYLAGLLHDIGKVLLDTYTPELFIKAVDLSLNEDMLLYKAEKTVYGFTHSEAGMWLAKQWNLPLNLVESIGAHHNPSPVMTGIDFEMTAIVHLADVFVRTLGIGSGGDRFVPEIRSEVYEKFPALVDNQLNVCLEEIYTASKKSISILNFK